MDKYTGRLGKIRRHCEDTEKTHEIARMISQISGTIESLKYMRDEKGIVVLPEEFVRLEADLAKWTAAFNVLDVTEVTDADFRVTPMNERVLPNSIHTRDPPVESTPGVE